MKRKLWRGLRSVWARGRMEREMEAELRFHLEHETEENIRRGMNSTEARAAALKALAQIAKKPKPWNGKWWGTQRNGRRSSTPSILSGPQND